MYMVRPCPELSAIEWDNSSDTHTGLETPG